MAGLVSPGVQVSVVDESFYTPAEPGTLPCIFVATAGNKSNGAGTGVAPGTLASNAGIPYLLTSQRDLVDTFGDPIFQTDSNNNPIHGGELNEYGLQAAYSYLGIANRAYVVRADLNLDELEPQAFAPGADPLDGTYWFDTSISLWGIQQWNGDSLLNGGQNFTNKKPIVITDETETSNTGSIEDNGYAGYIPAKSVGAVGEYAVVSTTTLNKVFYRNYLGNWVLVGSNAWRKSWPTIKGSKAVTSFEGGTPGTITIEAITEAGVANGISQTVVILNGWTIDDVVNAVSNSSYITARNNNNRLEIFSPGGADGAITNPDWVKLRVTINSIDDDISDILGILVYGVTGTAEFYLPKLQISSHTNVPEYKTSAATPRPSGSLWLKTTTPNLGAKFAVKQWNDSTKLWDGVDIPIYEDNQTALYQLDKVGGGANLLTGTLYAAYDVTSQKLGPDDDITQWQVGQNQPLGTYTFYRRQNVAPTTITSTVMSDGAIPAGVKAVIMYATDSASLALTNTATVNFTATGTAVDDVEAFVNAVNDSGLEHVSASITNQGKIVITHALGGDIIFREDSAGLMLQLGFSPYVSDSQGTANFYYASGYNGTETNVIYRASLWKILNYTASDNEVKAATADGTLWYNSIVDEVDILVHNGSEFVGYLFPGTGGQSSIPSPYYNASEDLQPDPTGPIVAATKPLKQSDGTDLQNGDIWIDTGDLENYPVIYRYNRDRTDLPESERWFEVDTTDQTTENGCLFADARYNTAGANSDEEGSITDLLASDYVDPDSPDPALYPKGMLLFNTRRSGFNVKKYVKNYLNLGEKNIRYNDEPMTNVDPALTYFPDRWVTESGNQNDGSGSFGRIAQRKVVVQALQAMVNSNQEIRDDESRLFNLMATPGYPELIGEMNTLNYDRGLTAFIVGDSPFRLTANATLLNNWATNQNLAVEDNDQGLVSTDPYMAVYYPCGFTSDNFGNNIVVPASHMMMRTIALSDQVSYPWFAPAGTRRGNITNATASGFISDEGEFVSVALNEGLRDTLYSNNVNPITFVTGAGLVCFGQKTRQLTASALDRINVARLIIYLRSQLKVLAKPYLFEPNDKITRDEIKQACETLLLELVGLRALYDFLVVCDESNNTPARIDRNELHVDIAIEPVKAIEFIYIPVRIKNTGEIAGL